MTKTLDEILDETRARRTELMDEVTQLEAILAAGTKEAREALRLDKAPAPRKRRSRKAGDRTKPKVGRPQGSGQRDKDVLNLLTTRGRMTINEMASEIGIKPNYLYRVLPRLAHAGQVKKVQDKEVGAAWELKG